MVISLAYYVTLLRRAFAEYCNQQLSEIGLSQGMIFFIIYIGRHPSCSPKELSRALRMDIGHTARSLVKLEQGGFITQKVNPDDRRARILNLTDSGKEAFTLSHELFLEWDKEVLESLSKEEREMLWGLLNKLIQKEVSGNDEIFYCL